MTKGTLKQYCKIDRGYFLARSGLLIEYAAELSQLQETCIQYLAAFPPRLQQVSETLLQRYGGHWQGVDWIQPLVLSAAWAVPEASRQTIALANALTAMYAQIQREAMDRGPQRCGDLLPLGALLHTHTLRQYQQLFPPTSYFWRLLEGYHLEWAEAVLWERQRQWGAVKRYSQEDILQLAGVRALLKISGAAVALLAGNQQIIMPLSSVLDQIHVALQLLDGVVNWREDLRARRATYFLTEVALGRGVREMTSLGRLNLEKFLATSPLPGKVTKRALNHLSAAKRVAGCLEAPALAAYLDELQTACQEIPHLLYRHLANSRVALERAPVSALL